MKYIQPQIFSNSYSRPHCGAITKQEWWYKRWNGIQTTHPKENHPLSVGTCQHCSKNTLCVQDEMYFSDTGNAPFPNPEMPESVWKLFLKHPQSVQNSQFRQAVKH